MAKKRKLKKSARWRAREGLQPREKPMRHRSDNRAGRKVWHTYAPGASPRTRMSQMT